MENCVLNIDNILTPILILDKKGIILKHNIHLKQILNLKDSSLDKKSFLDFFLAKEDTKTKDIFLNNLTSKSKNFTLEILLKDFCLNCKFLFDKEFQHFIVTLLDITKEKNLLFLLNKEKEKERAIIDTTENILIEDDGKEIIDCNKKFLEFFGVSSLEEFKSFEKGLLDRFINHEDFFSKASLESKNWIEHLKSLPSAKKIVSMGDCNSQIYAFKVNLKEFNQKNHIITFTDITDLIIEKNLLEYEANHDLLTQILNRRKLYSLINNALQIQKIQEINSIIMFDIDYFKEINDTYGHDIGDKVLIESAKVIKNNLRNNDYFARWGGEEFMILLKNTPQNKAFLIAEKLRKKLFEYKYENLPKITASFAVTSIKQNDSMDILLKRVDLALYEAKNSGRNKVCSL